MTKLAIPLRTVGEWLDSGYRGLRIPNCPTCRIATSATWEQLGARPIEDVVEVARRLRCATCGKVPAGLAVVASPS
jgi:hypothetical protein